MKVLLPRAYLAAAAAAALAVAQPCFAQNTLIVTPASLSFTSQGGQFPFPQTISVQSTPNAVQFTAQAILPSGSPPWLTVSSAGGSTPSTVMVFVNPTGLQAGAYNGTVRITAAAATNSPLDVPVTFTVSPVSQLTATPAQLSFSYVMGGTQPAAQNLAVGTTSGVVLSFGAAASTNSGGNWLTVTPVSGQTPANLTVSVNTAGLTPGSYSGTITLTPPSGAGGALQVPVTLTVNASPTLNVTPASIAFYYQIGGAPPAQQTLSLASPGASIAFSLTAGSPSNWLVVTPVGGFTPGDVLVGVSSSVLAGLGQGTYTGSIQITAPQASNSPVTVPVTLTVSVSPLISATPASLSFDVQPGGAAPAAKTFTVASSGSPVNFSVSTTTTTTGINWLTATPASGATPATISVGIAPSGLTLAPGTYTGTVVVSAPGAANSPLNIPVTLNVSNVPVLVANPNALSFVYQTGKSLPAGKSVSLTSSGAPITFTASASSPGNWLSISQTSGTTPATLGVFVNPAGLSAGSHTGTITLTPQTSGAAAQTVAVTLTVSNNPLISVSPDTLSFSFSPGGPSFLQQTLAATSTSDPLNFSVTWSESSGPAGWLAVTPLSAQTPANLTVFANGAALSPGIYTGSITVTASGANSQTVPVTVTVSTGNALSISPTSLSFEQPMGGAAPPAKTLQIASTGAALNFSATATTEVGNWLSVSPSSGATPGSISVSVNGAGLSQGLYRGTVTVVAVGASNSPQAIPVTLTVTAAQTIAVSPASLNFTYQQGGSAPAAQKFAVTSTGGSLSFTVTASTASGGNWLSASPAGGTTSGEVSVSVSPSGLSPGTYTGTVQVASAAAANSPVTVNVTLTVTALVVGPIGAVVNGASWVAGPIAPGEIITLGGTNIGPVTPAGLRLTPAGLVDTTLAETRVLFDGIPAPLIYVSRNQINCVVPYGIAGRVTTRVQVEYQGVRSDALELRVADTAPGIFTLDASGRGQGAILNQNFSVNGPANPAAKASVVMIYATGEGQTSPPGQDGLVTGSVLRRPLRDVSVTIGGVPARVEYAGSAPGFVAGVLQVNVTVPENAPSGNSVPVILTIGGVSSPATVSMAIR